MSPDDDVDLLLPRLEMQTFQPCKEDKLPSKRELKRVSRVFFAHTILREFFVNLFQKEKTASLKAKRNRMKTRKAESMARRKAKLNDEAITMTSAASSNTSRGKSSDSTAPETGKKRKTTVSDPEPAKHAQVDTRSLSNKRLKSRSRAIKEKVFAKDYNENFDGGVEKKRRLD